MSIKIQQIQSFSGFGDGSRRGEYFFSSGFQKTPNGIKPQWVMRTGMTNVDRPALGRISNFTNNQLFVYATSQATIFNGAILRTTIGHHIFDVVHTPIISSSGGGLITDQRNRLLYFTDTTVGLHTDTTWNDSFRSFGRSWHGLRSADLFEDWVVIGNVNQIALLNIRDDSFNANAFNMPDGFVNVGIKSNRTGVLMAFNSNDRGALVLWDCQSNRSIAPWLWLDEPITSMVAWEGNWIILAGQKLYVTNGHTLQELAMLPDATITRINHQHTILPGSIAIKDDYLFLGVSSFNNSIRQMQGVLILNLKSRLWEHCQVSTGENMSVHMGALFPVRGRFYVSFQIENTFYIAQLFNNMQILSPTSHKQYHKATYISPIIGNNDTNKVAEGVILNLSAELVSRMSLWHVNTSISLKIANLQRPMWVYWATSAPSLTLNTLRWSDTNQIKVGDEITIRGGINAGEVRHIISINNQDINNTIVTLDSDLPNLTEAHTQLYISPFQHIHTYDLNTWEIKDLYFNIQQKMRGKKFMLKLIIDLKGNSSFIPEITGMSFIYDDLGIK